MNRKRKPKSLRARNRVGVFLRCSKGAHIITEFSKVVKKCGYTLAELLIVTSIIGVLTAISVPIFMNARGKAIEAVNLSNIRSAMSAAYAESIFDDTKPLYFVYDTSTGRLTGDSGKGFDRSLPESADLTKERYENIYVWIDDGQIKTWPAMPGEKKGEEIPSAADLGNGMYQAVPGCRVSIDGIVWEYIGNDSRTVYGPGTKKGRKYWKRVE